MKRIILKIDTSFEVTQELQEFINQNLTKIQHPIQDSIEFESSKVIEIIANDSVELPDYTDDSTSIMIEIVSNTFEVIGAWEATGTSHIQELIPMNPCFLNYFPDGAVPNIPFNSAGGGWPDV